MSHIAQIPGRILVTNDDGIDAPGIQLLETLVRELSDDVWVIAPDRELSGAGRSVSLSNPIRMRQTDERHFRISGTPTDCVLMALQEIMSDGLPSMICSGINSGANLGEEVSYSGTVAAAMEGTLLGIRSVALSQVRQPGQPADFAPAERFAPDLIRKLMTLDDWPRGSLININFPNCDPDTITGVRLARQGQRPPGSFSIVPRHDARNVPYYWVGVDYPEHEPPADTDLGAVADRAISVTPIKLDFTDHAWQTQLGDALT